MADVAVAVIGAGQFGQEHLRAYASNPRCRVVAVVDERAATAAAAAAAVGAQHFYTSVTAMLADVKVDAVSVVTPGASHLDVARQLLEAGVAVLLEKPIALSRVDAHLIAQHAMRTGTVLMPAHILRFSPAYTELKRRLDAGIVGKPLAMSFYRHRGRDHQERFRDVHPAFMTAIHDIDLALWMTHSHATLEHASCVTSPEDPQPVVVWVRAQTESGIALSFDVSWSLSPGYPAPDGAELTGTSGVLRLATGQTDGPLHTADVLDTIVGERDDAEVALSRELDHFLNCVERGHQSPVVSVDEAVAGVVLAEDIATACRHLHHAS